MLILSASIVKSGSAWFSGLTNDLLIAAGNPGTQKIKELYDLDFIKWSEFNIQQLNPDKLKILTSPPVSEFTFVVKTHSAPIPEVNELLKKDRIFVTYIYRDPRDIVLAGLDAGRELRSRGIYERFGALSGFEEAVHWCLGKLRSGWDKWSEIENINLFKYEDLNNDTENELLRLSNLLGLRIPVGEISNIVEKHSAGVLMKNQSRKYHFNKGISNRFREEMSPEQLEMCNKVFKKYIPEMGYEF